MYLWKHRSLPLAFFSAETLCLEALDFPVLPEVWSIVDMRRVFVIRSFVGFFLLHLCTLHSSRCLGGGGETVCSVFETWMKPTEPLKHRYFNVGKSKSDQWHRAPWVPVHKVPSTKHRRWKSKVGDLH